jgi:hypothetical protein
MNPRALILILATALATIAQPAASPLAIWSAGSCSELIDRAQNLGTVMQESKDGTGVFVLTSREERYENAIKGVFLQNHYDASRLRIFYLPFELEATQKSSLWFVTSDERLPLDNLERHPPIPFDPKTTYLWGSADQDDPCHVLSLGPFVELLNKNPRAKAKLIVHSPARKTAIEFGTTWLNHLTTEWALPRDRITVTTGGRSQNDTWAEFYIVPARK